MKKLTFRDRLHYEFDNLMAKGPIAMIAWLFILSALVIVLVAGFVYVSGVAPAGDDGSRPGFSNLVWMGLMRTLDSGTMGGDTGNWPFLFSMLAVTLGGIFVVSMLIGVLTNGIEARVEELRKGRSIVVEKEHTVILGWSPQVFSIISELIIANENQKRPCVAILAENDKVEMEDEVQSRIPDTKNTRVVCRTGNPIDLSDLEIINLNSAKSIIVLSPESEDPDSFVIKTILAITNNPHRRTEPYHIVAEIRDPKNMEVARMVGGDETQLVLVGDLISRITVQTCRQSGLSVVYTELLDFGGDEIYFQEEPGLSGKTFREALFSYEDSAIIGLRFADGRIALNPPKDTVLQQGDKVIAVSQDDDTIRLSGISDHRINTSGIRIQPRAERKPERTLILGWNWRAATIINELDHYVSSGSEVLLVADADDAEVEIADKCSGLHHQKVIFRKGDTTGRAVLDDLQPGTYHHVIVLSYSDSLDPQRADAKTLVTLLHLRDIASKTGQTFSIVSEMLDIRNRELAEVTQADDFIVSDKLISLMLSQLSENKELSAVFQDLFDPEGSEIYLKPAVDYVQAGVEMNFYTVLEAALQRDEIAIGYRIRAHANDASKSYGVVVNPKKSATIRFSAIDKIIVLAED